MTKFQKKENLFIHVAAICKILNENGIQESYESKITGKISYFDWTTDKEYPDTTFLGSIYHNKTAFQFLKKNGYLDNKVCWLCGDEPISNQYKFSLTSPEEGFSICKTCYENGNNFEFEKW